MMPANIPRPTQPAEAAARPVDRFGMPRWTLFGALLLAALVFGAFFNGIKGPFIFDDSDSITNNPSIQSFKTAFTPPNGNGITVSGRPILNLSFAINRAISGEHSEGFHVGNILIHALSALVLWGVIRRTLKLPAFNNRYSDCTTSLAWLAALLWALHPLQTESVTYIVQRAESLVGLFYLLTLYCFIRYTAAPRWHWFAASVASCLLGMGAKEVMATVPLVIFLYDRTFVSGSFRAAWQKHGKLHLGYFLSLLLLAALVFGTQNRGGTVGTSDAVTHWSYLCTQTYAVVRYLWLSLCPTGLTIDYGTMIVSDALVIVSCGLVVIVALVATIWALRRKPMAGFLGAWFFALLAPSSSIIPVNTQTIAEHRMYLALAALIVIVALVAHRCLGRRSWILLALAILPAAFATVARNQLYLSESALWEDTVKKVPGNYRAWLNLASFRLHKDKLPAEAQKFCEHALKLKPDFPVGLNYLGQALAKLGRYPEALALVEKSLLKDPDNPTLNAGGGSAFMDAGEYEKAIPLLNKALGPNPANGTLNYNLANCLMKLGRDAKAEQHFRIAIEGSANDVDALNNLGTILRRSGRIDEAIGFFSRAIELSPQSANAYNNIGVAYLTKGDLQHGLQKLREAVRLDPQSFESRANLCQALMHANHYDEAIPLAETLLKEKPDADLYNNLGALYGQTGQLNKAEQAFRAALQVDPANTNARENLAKIRAYLESQRRSR